MAIRIIDHGSKEYEKMVALRNEVLRKPLGLTLIDEELATEKDDILIAAFDEDKILACCLLTKIDPLTCKLRQMAVHKSQQGKGIGESILQFAETVARDSGFRNMIMHARESALGFYEKMGYKVAGEVFWEVTIPHYMMQKILV